MEHNVGIIDITQNKIITSTILNHTTHNVPSWLVNNDIILYQSNDSFSTDVNNPTVLSQMASLIKVICDVDESANNNKIFVIRKERLDDDTYETLLNSTISSYNSSEAVYQTLTTNQPNITHYIDYQIKDNNNNNLYRMMYYFIANE